jgi:hypothetical protein
MFYIDLELRTMDKVHKSSDCGMSKAICIMWMFFLYQFVLNIKLKVVFTMLMINSWG